MPADRRFLWTANLPWSVDLSQAIQGCGAKLFHRDGGDADASIPETEQTSVGVDCLILDSSIMERCHIFLADISSFDAMMECNCLIHWKIARQFAPGMQSGTRAHERPLYPIEGR